MLKIKIDKVTVIRVTKCPLLAALSCTLYVSSIFEYYYDSTAVPRSTAVLNLVLNLVLTSTAVLQGRFARKGHLVARITVTSSIF